MFEFASVIPRDADYITRCVVRENKKRGGKRGRKEGRKEGLEGGEVERRFGEGSERGSA